MYGKMESSFTFGFVTDISPPDDKAHIAILRKKAAIRQFCIPDNCCEYIENRVTTDVRELEGALYRVMAFTSIYHLDITLESCQYVLFPVVPSWRRGKGADRQA